MRMFSLVHWTFGFLATSASRKGEINDYAKDGGPEVV